MEYMYIAMVLQEIGKEINEENIQKVFEVLDVEADDNKIRLMIPALAILARKDMVKEEK
jgi:ribosomal protein L12E/L44/L45/RPP1/RPP2